MRQSAVTAPLLSESLFDRPTSSIANTSQTTQSSSPPDSLPPNSRLLRLFFSGRDLPEPDSRSRASYAVIYHAQELPTRFSSVSDASTPPTPPTKEKRQKSSQPTLKRQSSAPALVRALSKPVEKIQKANSTALRAPGSADAIAAPETPEFVVREDGTHVMRTAWTKLGTTELARKFGRDVEFAKPFAFQFAPGAGQLIRVAFFDSTSRKIEKQRLIGTAQFRVSAVYATKGRPVSFPLKFLPVTEKDLKRSTKIPDGSLVVAGERVDTEIQKFRVDFECNRIVRAKALSTASVKRVFYTVHAILDAAPESDFWTLIYRSATVEMINRKQDGGSLEYNYFSSRRLKAEPGFVHEDSDGKERERAARIARGEAVDSSDGIMRKIGKLVGLKHKQRFFSLPGADIRLLSDSARLKLSLFEDNGILAGYDLIADTEFSISDLKARDLGDSSPIRVHANTVGKAVLKYVECGPDPVYFCLSLMLQGIR